VTDEHFMRLALAEAKKAAHHGDVPVGAVVARSGEAIAAAGNERELRGDPTAHAEILALRAASERLASRHLDGAAVFVTLEPCPMCAGALVLSRAARLVYGCQDARAGAAYSLYNIPQDPRLTHNLEIRTGVLEAESAELLRTFFNSRR
jgi:tRNA(adenine34) deaminase